jgi:hypothetical protein
MTKILNKLRKSITGHDFAGELADDDFQKKVRIQEHAISALEAIGSPDMDDELFENVVQVVQAEFIFWLAQTELGKAEKKVLIKRLQKEVK